MALIDIVHLHFAHDTGHTVFEDVRLQLDTDWRLGLIGRNGRGKTTFLKLLRGDLPHGGDINAPRIPMEYFPFPVERPDLSAIDVARQCVPDLEDWRLEREASLLELPLDALQRPYGTLSGGEATKLQLAALFLRDDAFPLIDEPTNHLDLAARRTVGRYLRGKRGFVLVSHDRSLLDACIDHVLSINRADIELQRGNFSSWQRNREWRDQDEREAHDRLEHEVDRLKESARRTATWSGIVEKEKYGHGPVDRGYIGHKAARMMQRAKSVDARRQKAVEEKSRLLHNIERQEPLSMRPLAFHDRRLAELRNVSVERGGRVVVRDVSLSVMAGDRVALQGRNGCGKSTLLQLVAGHPFSFQGEVEIPGSLRVSYLPQDTDTARGSVKEFAREKGIDEPLFRAVLHRLGLERSEFETDIASYSQGQKRKVLLAGSICQQAHLYIWDEPLNYIDVISRMQLENLLLEHCPTLLFVEHDKAFLDRVATSVIQL
ncbi:MAG: ATP-binding cassette domain-containing protein [Desulfovibrio sp.]|jgi:lincosamide and streptogramin A transport system ATP-binding/permease protein|nr:ATP-binding cassette domain-containing protein [Desulfovibrio sp.]